MARGVGRDGRTVQRRPRRGGQSAGDGLLDDLPEPGVELVPQAFLEVVEAGAGGTDAEAQPLQFVVEAAVVGPASGRMHAAGELVEDDAEHQRGVVGAGASAGVRPQERLKVEPCDGLVDESCEVVVGQSLVDVDPLG